MAVTFAFPTTTIFGARSIAELPARLNAFGARRPLIVTDAGVLGTQGFAKIVADPSGYRIFSDTKSNPTEENTAAATIAFLDGNCDAVIGLGGGSAIDVAKIIRMRVAHPNWELTQPVPSQVAPDELAPFIAIPTTAGTGSEVGRSSVITISGHKRVIFHPALLAKLVILDPELTVELPPHLTAATGADALTHCIESFTSLVFHPLCDGIALEGIRLIGDALRRAVKAPADLDARGKMLIAAMMGGIAFQKDLGAAHALAHPLSSLCGMHHGLANALVLPTVMQFNATQKPGIYERVGQALGLKDPSDHHTIEAIESLLNDIGIARGLGARRVQRDQLDALADQAFADTCHLTNPVPVTRETLYRLYQEAF